MSDRRQKPRKARVQDRRQSTRGTHSGPAWLYYFKRGDIPWIIVFLVLNFGLVKIAQNYLNSVNQLSTQEISRNPAQLESSSLESLRTWARKGDWKEMENVRKETAARLIQTNARPSIGEAIYFYPETLKDSSLEKIFATEELQPGILALQAACVARKKSETQKAFTQLESRVLNFELGAVNDRSALSVEAEEFLHLYQELSQSALKRPRSK